MVKYIVTAMFPSVLITESFMLNIETWALEPQNAAEVNREF